MRKTNPTIGIIGAGKLGIVLSQLARRAGYSVYISNSKDPSSLSLTLSVLSPGTQALNRDELIAVSDVIILAMPLSKYKSLQPELLAGKVVIDAMNYWWEIDGTSLEAIHPLPKSSSEHVQDYFSKAHIVKAFNHVGYHDLFDHATRGSDKNKRAVAIAGNDTKSVDIVSHIVRDLGFAPHVLGPLTTGVKIEPGGNVFGVSVSPHELISLLKEK